MRTSRKSLSDRERERERDSGVIFKGGDVATVFKKRKTVFLVLALFPSETRESRRAIPLVRFFIIDHAPLLKTKGRGKKNERRKAGYGTGGVASERRLLKVNRPVILYRC